MAVSIDRQSEARELGLRLGLAFPILSDPGMRVIQAYGMKGVGMEMADMGYVVIDRQGRMRAKTLERRFGDNINDIVGILEKLNTET